jgi:predicted aspartyl protease
MRIGAVLQLGVPRARRLSSIMRVTFVGLFAFLAIPAISPGMVAHAKVPLSLAKDNHLVVPAYVNGSGPYPFILDTGADQSAVYGWFASKLNLTAGKSEELSGQTGTTSTPTYRLQSVSVDGRTLKNAFAYGLPNRHDAGEEAGVVGNDLMDGALAVFDFPCRTVSLYPKSAKVARLVAPRAKTVIGGTIRDGTLLTLPVDINGARGVAFLDTGSRDSRISLAFARAAGIDPAGPAFRDAGPIFGANSKAASSRIGPVGTVRFAGVTITKATARVMDLPAFRSAGVGKRVMILGTDLMRDRRLIYDHAARRVWFSASVCAKGRP